MDIQLLHEREAERGKEREMRGEGRERGRFVLLHVIVIVLSSLINLSTLQKF